MPQRHARLLVVALAVSACAVGGSGALSAAAAPAAAPVCDLLTSTHAGSRSETRGCLQVGATLSAAPALGQTATLDLTVRSAAALDGVDIDAALPPSLQWVQVPAGLRAGTRVSRAPQTRGTLQTAQARRSLGAGQVLRYRGVVKAVATGPAELVVRAGAASAPGATATDAVHLTISADRSRFGLSTDPTTDAVPAAGAPGVARAAAAAGQACVAGTWTWTDVNGGSRPGGAWKVQALDRDGSTDTVLETGTVSDTGTYSLCFSRTEEDGTGQDVAVRFTADTGNWRVQDLQAQIYAYTSSVFADVADGSTTTVALTPGDPYQMRVGAAFASVLKAWRFVPGPCWDQVGVCSPVVVVWTPDWTGGSYFGGGDPYVHLDWDVPDTPTVVLHEVAHSIMDDVYDHLPPPANCGPHGITTRSNQYCAWVEGWAEWFPAVVLDDPYFRWNATTALNLEVQDPAWDTGDAVEGRVAAALIDLTDAANEPGDEVSEGVTPIWTTFQEGTAATFADFWAARAAGGLDVGAAATATLAFNTIQYSNPFASCTAQFQTVNAWPGGWTAEVKVTAGNQAVGGWEVTLTVPSGLTVTGFWNGIGTGSTGTVTVTNAAYNGQLAAGASTAFGFQGSGTPDPRGITFACTKI